MKTVKEALAYDPIDVLALNATYLGAGDFTQVNGPAVIYNGAQFTANADVIRALQTEVLRLAKLAGELL